MRSAGSPQSKVPTTGNRGRPSLEQVARGDGPVRQRTWEIAGWTSRLSGGKVYGDFSLVAAVWEGRGLALFPQAEVPVSNLGYPQLGQNTFPFVGKSVGLEEQLFFLPSPVPACILLKTWRQTCNVMFPRPRNWMALAVLSETHRVQRYTEGLSREEKGR